MTDPFARVQPALVAFDKDGTLIDFNFMWTRWIGELAARLEHASGRPLREAVFRTMGFDAARERVIAGSPLAVHSMRALYDLTADIVERAGVERSEAERSRSESWFVPDPVALARPLADLPQLFSALHSRNLRTAIVTSDDRAPTARTLEALGIAELTDTFVCADDGLPNKPAPDMLLAACHKLGIVPERMVVVGDAVADLRAGRAAGAGACIGVLSGVSRRADLEPFADRVIPSVGSLLELLGA